MILEVGKKYNELIGAEGPVLDFTSNGFMLKIKYNKPTKSEIDNITKGYVQYKILYLKNVIILLVKFGNEMWMDIPFFGNLDIYNSITSIGNNNSGYALNILISDAETGELKGIRVLAINNSVSKNLYKFIENQKERGYTQQEYDQALMQVYSSYTTNQLVKLAVAGGKAN